MRFGRELRTGIGLTVVLGMAAAGCSSEPPATPAAPAATTTEPSGAAAAKTKPAGPGSSDYEDKPGGIPRGR
jgi:hypothetical protein